MDKVRDFQRKLYRKAKQERGYKFYTLYDKIYRRDVLLRAFDRVRANKGSSGVDGVSIEEYERNLEQNIDDLIYELKEGKYKPQPVKRVYIPKVDGSKRPIGIPTVKDRIVQTACKMVIEPIFEADFDSHSYGFRPKRKAHQAIKAIERLIRKGYVEILDADIRKYFDTIPHDKLVQKVRRRVADGRVIWLIKMWLMTPVAELTDKGRWRLTGGKKNKYGTPQGGVISPLLANIYLHDMDDSFFHDEDGPGRDGEHILIRYADDFVVLSKKMDEGVKGWIENKMQGLGLILNSEKTRSIDIRSGTFEFLGFRFSYQRSLYYGDSRYLVIEPCDRAIRRLRERIRETVKRWRHYGLRVIIDKVNQILIGWKVYFNAVGYPRRVFRKVNYYLTERFYFWSRHLSQRRSKLFKPGVYTVLKREGLYFL